jgi:phosphatidylserine/phosphatidylglycerophosphate/cardiolipin synthase-like enzyme
MEDGQDLGQTAMRELSRTIDCTEDDAAVMMDALYRVGVLAKTPRGWFLQRARLNSTAGYRAGVRDALAAQKAAEPQATLLVAPPADATEELIRAFRQHAKDLRFAVLDLIASAQNELLLASPYWDEETAGDLTGPLQGRLDAGVKVRILTRDAQTRAIAQLRIGLRQNHEQFRVYEWYVSDGQVMHASTFHLKALVQDHGVGAYLGSANFTLASLRSRMELGVRLEGQLARDLSALLYASLGAAHESL